MRRGVLEQIATPDELYHRPSTAFVAEFVGTMNHLPGRLIDLDTVEVLDLRRPISARPDTVGAGDPVDVLVRPEAVVVTEDTAGSALVAARTFHGAMTRLSIRLADTAEILADVPSPAATALLPGTPVSVSLSPNPVLLA
jgi:putative spermidine/putrescine transport system ATP-binding protein